MEYLCCPKHDVCVICVLNIASDPIEHPDIHQRPRQEAREMAHGPGCILNSRFR